MKELQQTTATAAVFILVSKVNSRLVWFCFIKLCDLLAKFAPLFQPKRNKTKTNRVFLAPVFSA